jgi:hypothetical protein
MKVIATAKIIAVRIRLLDRPPAPFRGDHAGQPGHGGGYRLAAELGYDIGLGGGSILDHGESPFLRCLAILPARRARPR